MVRMWLSWLVDTFLARSLDPSISRSLNLYLPLSCSFPGSTRYPTIGDKDFIRWINGNQTLDDDMDEIRDTCAYYFHDCSHHTNSQTAAYITSSPFLLVEHIISLLFNSLFRLLRIGNQRDKILTDPSDTAESKSDYLLTNILRNSQSVSSLVSIAVYYATWFLGGSWYRVGTCLALMAGQSLYNAVLFRKGYFAFLQSFIFGNLFVISFVNDNLSNEKSEKMTDTESDTDDEGKSQKQAREGLVSGTTATTGNTAAAQKSAAETTSPTYNNNLILPFHIVKTTSDGHMVDAVEVGFDYRQDRSFGIERSTQFDQRLSQVPRRDVQKMTDDGKVEDRSSSSGKVDNDNDDGGIPTSISKHRYNKRRIEERFYSRKLQLLQHSAYSENVGKNLLDSSMNTESYTSPVNHDGNNKIQKRGNDGDTNLASINNNDDDDVDKGNGKNGNGVDKDMMMNVRYQNVTGAEDFDDDDSTDIGLRLDGDHMFESMSYISAPLHHQQRGEVAEHDSTSLKEEHGQEEEHNSSTLDDKEVSEYRFTMGSPKKDHSRTYTIDDDGVGAPAPAPLRITKRRRSFMKPSKLRKSKSGGSKESDGSDFSGSSLKASTRLWSFDSSILDYPQIITARINSGGAMTCLSSDDDGGSKDKENVNNDDDEENNAQAVQCDVHFPCNADDDDENDENDENKNNNIAARGHSFLNKVFDASAPLSRCSSLSAEDGLEYGERIAVDALAADEESLPHYSTLPTQLPFFPPPPPPPGPPPSSSRNKRKRRNTTTTKTGVTAPPLRITSSGKTNDGGDSVSIFSQLQHVYDSYSMW